MSPADLPPSKKLRLSTPERSLNAKTLPLGASSPSKLEPPPRSGRATLDGDTVAAIIGHELDPKTLKQLADMSGGNMERAINMYFDGSWNQSKPSASSISAGYGSLQPQISHKRDINGASRSAKTKMKAAAATQPSSFTSAKDTSGSARRYLGSFGVEGWATTSGTNLVSHGEKVSIERQKILSKPQGAKRAAVKQRKTADIVVRFSNLQGREVGRLQQNVAAYISTLIDQGVAAFEGVCVYAPERIRTNETVFLQLRCFLLKSAFDRVLPALDDDNRVTDLFAAKETEREKELRLRQAALVKLFQEIGLEPVEASGQEDRKQRRAALLKVTEDAEKKDLQSGSGLMTLSQKPAGDPEVDDEPEDGKMMEQDQLDALYRKAQNFNFDSPEAEPSATFAMDLRRYQKQALHWMLSKERNDAALDKGSMHPLWEKYDWPLRDQDDRFIEAEPELDTDCFYVNPYSGDLSLEFPRQEVSCFGGILADEMGLGKTIEMLSLIHTNRQVSKAMRDKHGVLHAKNTTLVIAPMSLLAQWESEANAASKPDTLKTFVYYGNERKVDLTQLLATKGAPDVVITSYGNVMSEYSAGTGKGGLFDVHFLRIILDEAHHIKNRVCKTARACYELLADHRWVLSGTPIVNRLEDLFSLVRFLRVDPWQNFSFWKTFISLPFENGEFIRALDVVQTVLEPLCLRRTKEMKLPNGDPLVPLPPKKVIIEKLKLSQQEQDVYDYIQDRVKRNFYKNIEAGTLMKSYTSILAQILRLRQSCCHPNLIRKKEIVEDETLAEAAYDEAHGFSDDMDLNALLDKFTVLQDDEEDGQAQSAAKYGAHVLQQIKDEAGYECPFCCSEPMEEQVVTGCWHSACKSCWLDYIEHEKSANKLPLCVTCRAPINPRDLFLVHRDLPPSTDITLRRINTTSTNSTKIQALISHLTSLPPSTKSCVFSQFTSFLDLISAALTRHSIPFVRFDGTMSQPARRAVIDSFRSHAGGMVLLISLRAGGVGLNLTQASRVYLMDPWWSFAVEAQAIDRVHRMGQGEEVEVVRFVVEGSVEERMVEKIQARKKFIASSLGMMSQDEKRQQRIDDIRDLLAD